MSEVPKEYRLYIKPEDIPKLPKGVKVYRGKRGGLYIDKRELQAAGSTLEGLGMRGYRQSLFGYIDEESKDEEAKIKRFVDMLIAKLPSLIENYVVYNRSVHITRKKSFDEEEEYAGKLSLYTLADWDYEKPYEFVDSVTDMFESCGIDTEYAESLAKGMYVFRVWESNAFESVAGCIEELIHELSGNDRPKRDCEVDEVEGRYRNIVEYILNNVTIDDVVQYKKFSEAIFERYYGNEYEVYRGISFVELMQIMEGVIEDDELDVWSIEDILRHKLHGTLQSWTIDYNTAGLSFSKYGVAVKATVKKENVWGGWWNASGEYLDEAEIIVEIPKGGLDVELVQDDKWFTEFCIVAKYDFDELVDRFSDSAFEYVKLAAKAMYTIDPTGKNKDFISVYSNVNGFFDKYYQYISAVRDNIVRAIEEKLGEGDIKFAEELTLESLQSLTRADIVRQMADNLDEDGRDRVRYDLKGRRAFIKRIHEAFLNYGVESDILDRLESAMNMLDEIIGEFEVM